MKYLKFQKCDKWRLLDDQLNLTNHAMLIISEEFVHEYISYMENGLTKLENIEKTLIFCK